MKQHAHVLEHVLFLAVSVTSLVADRAAPAATSNAPSFAVKTVYNGLIYREDGVLPGETGYFRIDVSRNGRFTGKLFVGAQSAHFHGRFNQQGTAYVSVKVGTGKYEFAYDPDGWSEWDIREVKKLKWTLILQLTNGLDQVAGQILSYTRTGWTASVLGDRARSSSPTNPVPEAGQYTVVIPQNPDSQGGPEGDGCGTVTVDKSGSIRLLGVLPDSSKITASAILSEGGVWPLFASLRAGNGVLVGWLYFTNSAGSDVAGQLTWIRLRHPRVRFYREGFTNQTRVLASRYVRPISPSPVLPLTDAVLVLRGGDLSSSLTNSLVFQTPTKMTGTPDSQLTVHFSLSTGLFMGRTETPERTRVLSFTGATLQNQTVGFGYFLGNSRSGEVIIAQLPWQDR